MLLTGHAVEAVRVVLTRLSYPTLRTGATDDERGLSHELHLRVITPLGLLTEQRESAVRALRSDAGAALESGRALALVVAAVGQRAQARNQYPYEEVGPALPAIHQDVSEQVSYPHIGGQIFANWEESIQSVELG